MIWALAMRKVVLSPATAALGERQERETWRKSGSFLSVERERQEGRQEVSSQQRERDKMEVRKFPIS